MPSQDEPARPVVEPRTLRVNDFCKAYGVGRSTAYELINAGKLKSIRLGGRRLILRDSAEALLREGT